MKFDYSLKPGQTLLNRFSAPQDEPLVSIITPYYNAAKYWEQAYCSVMNQTFPWFEWIIMDDGSNEPASIHLLDGLETKDARIRVFHQRNAGAATARNNAVARAQTELLFFFDADDLMEANLLEMLFFALRQNSEAAWAYSDIVTFGEKEYLWQQEFSSDLEKKENVVSVCSLVRKQAFLSVGGYSVRGRFFNEDWHLWLKLLRAGYVPAHVRQLSFWYRRLPSGGLAAMKKDPEAFLRNAKAIEEVVKDVPDGMEAINFGQGRTRPFSQPERWEVSRTLPYQNPGKTRILLLVPHMACGGADLFNLDLIRYLDHDKYEIGVITTLTEDSQWRQVFLRATNDVFELYSFLSPEDWPAFVAYYIQTRDVKIVLNISSYHGYYWYPWLRKQFPSVVLMDCVHAEGLYWRSGGYPRISGVMRQIVEKTFVSNDFTRQKLMDQYSHDPDKLQLIHTGIDETACVYDPQLRMRVRKELGVGDRPVILYLCRVEAEKRPFLMLEIAARVRTVIPDVCFLVVGGGSQLDILKAQIGSMHLEDTVLCTDLVPETKPYYACADLFLLCSIKEGLSITTMESLAYSLPVISADVGSQYELVDASTGRLIPCMQDEAKDFDARSFPAEEIDAYAAAITEILQDPDLRTRMRGNCRDKIFHGFTRQEMLQTADDVFMQLMTGSEALAQRRKVHEATVTLSGVADELATIYQEYDAMEHYTDYLAAQLQETRQTVQSLCRIPYVRFRGRMAGRMPKWLRTFLKKLLGYR